MSNAATSTSVTTPNVTLIVVRPSLVLLPCNCTIPGVPLICVSIGVVTVCSTVCASAPVKAPVTCTTGGVILGYWLIGKLYSASNPTTTITIEITIAVIGLLINTSAI